MLLYTPHLVSEPSPLSPPSLGHAQSWRNEEGGIEKTQLRREGKGRGLGLIIKSPRIECNVVETTHPLQVFFSYGHNSVLHHMHVCHPAMRSGPPVAQRSQQGPSPPLHSGHQPCWCDALFASWSAANNNRRRIYNRNQVWFHNIISKYELGN